MDALDFLVADVHRALTSPDTVVLRDTGPTGNPADVAVATESVGTADGEEAQPARVCVSQPGRALAIPRVEDNEGHAAAAPAVSPEDARQLKNRNSVLLLHELR